MDPTTTTTPTPTTTPPTRAGADELTTWQGRTRPTRTPEEAARLARAELREYDYAPDEELARHAVERAMGRVQTYAYDYETWSLTHKLCGWVWWPASALALQEGLILDALTQALVARMDGCRWDSPGIRTRDDAPAGTVHDTILRVLTECFTAGEGCAESRRFLDVLAADFVRRRKESF